MGFRFAPRIRDLADKRLYVPGKDRDQPTLTPLIGGKLNLKLVRTQWEEILRLAASIRHGTVTASLIIRKLASYPGQNSLHSALREVGRIERSLFMLEWMKDPELRRRVQPKSDTLLPGRPSWLTGYSELSNSALLALSAPAIAVTEKTRNIPELGIWEKC